MRLFLADVDFCSAYPSGSALVNKAGIELQEKGRGRPQGIGNMRFLAAFADHRGTTVLTTDLSHDFKL